jgi:hypothetical protein
MSLRSIAVVRLGVLVADVFGVDDLVDVAGGGDGDCGHEENQKS